MRVPISWLAEYCDPGLSVSELADALNLKSTEVERIDHAGAPSSEGFVVGEVVSVESHPDADRLSVCDVDTGDGTRTIVCGAPNVAAGQRVPVALPGAVLPGGRKLERAKLRGVLSDGMILSEAELEIGDESAGIMVLNQHHAASSASRPGAADPKPGTALSEVLAVGQPVLELEVNSNRVDCLGIYGVAREVRAITESKLADPPWAEDAEASGEGRADDYASIEVRVPELCPRFTARVFTDVTVGPSPAWLKERLTAAGQRPINNVVDITNYVMLLTAQPLHAFDLDEVPDGALIVRTAEKGERMTTLDGVERSFDTETVLVCDREGPSGIAGIMGGARSEVSEGTTRVLMEVANWNGVNILRTSRKLGLRSEASNRFEKQLHPELALQGQRVAAKLMVELCGAKLVPGTNDVAAEIPAPHELKLRSERVEELLGMPVEPAEAKTYLERLGFEAKVKKGDVDATVPVHRHYDVTREVDLIEEVGRIHGLDRLPETLPKPERGGLTREQRLRRRAEDVMRDLGFGNVLGLSVTDPGAAERLRIPEGDVRRSPITVRNPLSVDHSALRTTLLGSLLDSAAYNLARGAERVALFESGRAYLASGAPLAGGVLGGEFAGEQRAPAFEPHRIGALVVGPLRAAGWRDDGAPGDFFALKGVLEALAEQMGAELSLENEHDPVLHPGRSARVIFGEHPAGWLGEIHPLVLRAWEIDTPAAGFEIDLAEAVGGSIAGRERYRDVTTHPAVVQDLAVVIPEDVPASKVRTAVEAGGADLLQSIRVFDVYTGEQLGAGRRSLAMRLEFSAPDRTLTDEEVAERREAIKSALERIGGSLRE
ncbi:MAG: phenylalanine--tRNA ligase subunit beta [Solirubrobacterales bacterium]